MVDDGPQDALSMRISLQGDGREERASGKN
jgi:hypothetical protein